MNHIEYNFKTTIIGSMPHKNAGSACTLIARHLKDIPAWPQLPKRSSLEAMDVQFGTGFPGLDIIDGKAVFNRSAGFEQSLESLYEAYLTDNYARYAVAPEYAAGLYYFLNMAGINPWAVKGQVSGPVSWCLGISDEEGKSILYDDILSDAAARMLAMSGAWQEKVLKTVCKNTIIFIDEPAMSSYGSAYFSLSREKATTLINESMTKIKCLKGIHCCGNTDWGLILSTNLDILSLDAYQYGDTLSLYPEAVKAFLARGGGVAWGIVPNSEPEIIKETPASLKDRLEETMAPLARAGIDFKLLAARSMLTPSCSLSALSEESAEHTLVLLNELSDLMKARHL
ncbi:MAG: methionine synthase [Dehalococcoidales bacterium]|nr:methionine synthase [Dehalococcoidales bacterium]MDD5498006.1 methionine synthase [Dehalococcoidales bacterium]